MTLFGFVIAVLIGWGIMLTESVIVIICATLFFLALGIFLIRNGAP